MERQKFAYYAQAWHAAWEGRPLYPERIEAWTHGPVCRDAWVAETYGPPQPACPLGDFARRVVDSVLAFYGQLSAAQLRGLTHNEGPWIAARGGLPDTAKSDEEISVNDMRRYYSRKSALGEDVPVRPILHEDVPAEETLRCADIEISRWREALDELARR
jgi:uncharacterized phage-associated protein